MLQWVTRPTLAELTAEFCRQLEEVGAATASECAVALTGGSSAAVFYDAWAARAVGAQFRFYWSDERLVPPNHPDSNFKLAADHLLRPAQVPDTHVHPAPTYLAPEACAAAYATEIRRHVTAGANGLPQFPLVILGLGADGHTGSLLPGRDPYEADDLLVRAVEGSAAHPHGRVTFTPKLINAAARVWFVVTGAPKAWAVEQLGSRTAPVMQVPALVVDPKTTQITIFADQGSTGGRTPGEART
jgi:6-phosphogluconolactonase